jgi:hypothetical protein
MSRIGKIARLPRPLREQLNQRLENGESGPLLVDWLNRLPDVNLVMKRNFDGRPITEQNLSDWRQGGFLEWQQLRESCEWVRAMTDEVDQIDDEAGVMPLSDCLSSLASLAMGRRLRQLASGSLADAESRTEFFEHVKHLTRMRREDRESRRMRNFLEMHGGSSRRGRQPAGDLDET